MKHFLLAFTFVAVGATAASAQLDATVNLTGISARNPQVAAEYAVSDKFGVELGVGVALGSESYEIFAGDLSDRYEWNRGGLLATLQGKLYFSPDEATEGLYAAAYARYRNVSLKNETLNGEAVEGADDLAINRLALGAALGYKAVFKRFVFETAGGAGFAPVSDNEYLSRFDGGAGFFDSLDNLDLYFRASIGFRIIE